MKLKIGILLAIGALACFIFLARQRCKKKSEIEIFYNPIIDLMPITTLKNLRGLDAQEKEQLFEWFAPQFAIEGAIAKIKQEVTDPQIVLWFADHKGKVPKRGALLYKNQIFNPLAAINSKFWLVDLAAWRFLSLDQMELQNCADFAACMNQSGTADFSKAGFNSLINDTASMLDTIKELQSFGVLRSSEFFAWLNQLPFTIDQIDPMLADLIIRTDLREGAARYSLHQLGYNPLFLEISSTRVGKKLVDADSTQIFPLLQYLEGIYYALRIIEDCAQKGNECSVVFLLPNKEFTYYMVPGESAPFETFRKNICSLLARQKSYCKIPKVKIYFYPFSYGHGFYDQPFDDSGPCIKKDELVPLLSNLS